MYSGIQSSMEKYSLGKPNPLALLALLAHPTAGNSGSAPILAGLRAR